MVGSRTRSQCNGRREVPKFVVIVAYNSASDIRRCLESVVGNGLRIVVIDNNSSDKTVKIVKECFGDVDVIESKRNLGFAASANVGIRYALRNRAGYVIVLNPDTVVKDNAIDKLVQFLSKDRMRGIAGPAIEHISFINGKKQYDLGGNIKWFLGRAAHINVEKIQDFSPATREYVSGCCMVVKARVFREVGLFDERFFMYYEDGDFCTRAIKAGFSVWNVPRASIYHKFAGSSGWLSPFSAYHLTRSAILFGRKWLSPPNQVLDLAWIFIQSILFSRTKVEAGLAALRAMKETL